jgi:hypothetical protein
VKTLVLGLSSVLAIAAGLFIVGERSLAWVVSYGGTSLVLLILIAWVVAVDSKKRWPGAGWIVRLGRLLTFYDEGRLSDDEIAKRLGARRP